MIRCVVFDFDGTLVLSNEIKHEGFLAIANDFVDGLDKMYSILENPPGDRYAIFNKFAEIIGDSADAANLANLYGAWCEGPILSCSERQGAKIALQQLQYKGLSIYLNSATPENPLRSLVNKRYNPGTFDGIYGGHDCKVANLKKVMGIEQLEPFEIAMIGDGIDDWQAAKDFGCHFIGVKDGSLYKGKNRCNYFLDDLSSLCEELEKVKNTQC
jgi:phosphoglycolate phosphatase